MSELFTVGMDNEKCTGCTLCAEIAPSIFAMREVGSLGTAFVVEPITPIETAVVVGANSWVNPDGTIQAHGRNNMFDRARVVAPSEVDKVIEAAEECPGENIYVEAL